MAQGAEGRIFTGELLGERVVVKERFKKTYRHPVLNEKLTEKRFFQEARNMLRARKQGVHVPSILFLDPLSHKIYMQYIFPSLTVKSFLQQCPVLPPAVLADLATKLARSIAKIHDIKLIHGDLTTTNFLIQPELPLTNEMQGQQSVSLPDILSSGSIGNLYMLDFGLSYQSGLPEDKAVDLYVLERAIISMHTSCGQLFDRVVEEYQLATNQGFAVVKKLNQVRNRGRKRLAFG